MKKGIKKTLTTIGVMAGCFGVGAGTYMYMMKKSNKKKINKYMSYLDNK